MSLKIKTKNLFNRDTDIQNVYLNPSTGQEQSEGSSESSTYINCSPNTTYTVSFKYQHSGYFVRIHGYNSSKTWNQLIWQQNSGTVGEIITYTFTTTANDNYIRMSFPKLDEIVMLVEGSTAPSEYIPYMAEIHELYTRSENLCPITNKTGIGWATIDSDLLTFFNSLSAGTYTWSIKYTLTQRNDTSDASCYGLRATNSTTTFGSNGVYWGTAGVGTSKTYTTTFTITDAMVGTFSVVYMYGCGVNGVGISGKADITEIMVVEGSTAPSEYIPYMNYIEELYKRSINLYDGTITHFSWNGTNNTVIVGTNYKSFVYPASTGDTFTISRNTTGGVYGIFFTKEYPSAGVSIYDKSSGGSYTTRTATATEEGINYVICIFTEAGDDISGWEIMLVKGSTAPSTYIPYMEKIFDAGYDTTITNTSNISMPNARAKSLAYSVSGNSKRTIDIDGITYTIPNEITLVEHTEINNLASSAKNGFNLGFKWSEVDTMVIGLCQNTAKHGNDIIVCGNTTSTPESSFSAGPPYININCAATTYYHTFIGSSLTDFSASPAGFNDEEEIADYTFTFTATSDYYIHLGGWQDDTWGADNNFNKIICKKDGSILCIYISAIKNSEVGFYDLISGTFKGNQHGTGTFTAGNELPTPDNNLGVIGVGDKTENLFDKSSMYKKVRVESDGKIYFGSEYLTIIVPVEGNTQYTIDVDLTGHTTVSPPVGRIAYYDEEPVTETTVGTIGASIGTNYPYTLTTPSTTKYVAIWLSRDSSIQTQVLDSAIVVEGSTTPSSSLTAQCVGIQSGTNYAIFNRSAFSNASVGTKVSVTVSGTTYQQEVKAIDSQYIYIENRTV